MRRTQTQSRKPKREDPTTSKQQLQPDPKHHRNKISSLDRGTAKKKNSIEPSHCKMSRSISSMQHTETNTEMQTNPIHRKAAFNLLEVFDVSMSPDNTEMNASSPDCQEISKTQTSVRETSEQPITHNPPVDIVTGSRLADQCMGSAVKEF